MQRVNIGAFGPYGIRESKETMISENTSILLHDGPLACLGMHCACNVTTKSCCMSRRSLSVHVDPIGLFVPCLWAWCVLAQVTCVSAL